MPGSADDREIPGMTGRSDATGTAGSGCGSGVPPLSPIGLTAAGLFAGGEVSRAAGACDNLAAVWWGAYAPSTCMPIVLSSACTGACGRQKI